MIKWFEKHNKISWTITVAIGLIIFYFSSLSFEKTPKLGGTGTNTIIYHIIIFFLLTFFLLISLVKGKNKDSISLAIILSFTYSLLDEFHQYFVPGRSSSFSDVLLDSIGVFFSFILYSVSLKIRPQYR
mgnify:CR=1 FL=1